MDDFLHNLRSGKLKQPDRGRRDYPDYKGPQRRAGNERRRTTDYYTKVTNENFALIKDSLDMLVENQKRIADAVAGRKENQTRIADALEAIAAMMGRHFGYTDILTTREEAIDAKPEEEPKSGPVQPEVDSVSEGQPRLLDTISTMRTQGVSWEKIARHLDDTRIPTVSGKGKWRGQAVKKFWDANTGSKAI